MDYAGGGDLAQKIKKHAVSRKYIKEDLILDWFTQMCLALKHVHDRKIIHRDIKAQNVFLMSDGTIRFGDFGVARILDYTVAKAQTQVGTPYYITPEILRGRSYTSKADVWSLGVLLFELCALDVPIKAGNLNDLYRRIMNFRKVPALPAQYSSTVKDLISSMMRADASKRPSVKDLLEHPAVSSRISKFLTDEEQKEEFGHTVLHDFKIDKKSAAAPAPKPTRPYSARGGRVVREEAKVPRTPVNASSKQPPRNNGRITPSRLNSARGSADRMAAKKPLGSKDQNRLPVQGKKAGAGKLEVPKRGMGARKNSEGALHVRKASGGLGFKNSPSKAQNFHFANKYGKPAPSQTPRMNGAAKKIGSKAPVGFQKARPGSAAYKRPGSAAQGQGFGGGVNHRRFF